MIKIPSSNYDRQLIVRLLKSPYIRFQWEYQGDTKRLWANEVDFESRAANIVEGKANWKPAFDALKDDLNSEIGSPDTPEPKRDNLKKGLIE